MKPATILIILLTIPACSHEKPKNIAKAEIKVSKHAKKEISVQFIGKKGVFRVSAELAVDFTSREKGLMFRKKLASDKGMLFVFPHEAVNQFWMKNTLIPLDMVFINKDLRVIGIVHHANPLDETPVGPDNPSMYVVELPAGIAKSKGIVKGTIVIFKPLPPKAVE